MAYEKYIKKDGKIYGPYLYQSKRVDGKVVSEYQGQKRFSLGKFAWIIPLALLIIIGAYFIGQRQGNPTGNAILNLNANYQQGKTLDGQLKISLNPGELIPVSSNIVFENGGQTYQYPLKTLVSEQTVSGNYFVNGKDINGSGDGFGIAGTKTIYPDVQFTMIVSSSNGSEVSNANAESPATTETSSNTTTGNTTLPENNSSSAGTVSSASNTTNAQPPARENNSSGAGLLGVVANFFLGLRPTGYATFQFQNEIQGNVSEDHIFTYTLQPGETAEIKPTSVHTDGGNQLPDSTIKLTTNGNTVYVTTDYSVQQQGFGSDYIGTGTKDISINLNQLNLSSLQQGPIDVGILYNGEEIVSIQTNLIHGEINGNSSQVQTQTSNQNENANVNNSNVNQSINNVSVPAANQNLALTDFERSTLINEFGNISVQTAEAQEQNGFIVVRYEIGTYWIENSYPANLDNSTLNSLMNEDKIKFLKDIAASLSQQNPSSQSINSLLGNSSY